MDPHQLNPDRIPQKPGKCLIVRHLNQLDLERIALSTINDRVTRKKAATVISQQREHCVLEYSKVNGAFVAFP